MTNISNKNYSNQIIQSFENIIFRNCTFNSCRISRFIINCEFYNCTFINCVFAGEGITNVIIKESLLKDSLFTCSIIQNFKINKTTIEQTEFLNIELMENINFLGSTIKKTKLRNTLKTKETIITGGELMIDWSQGVIEGITLDGESIPNLIGTYIKNCSAIETGIQKFQNCVCEKNNFSKASAFQCVCEYTTFVDCDFTESDFQYGNLNNGIYINCKFNKANMENCDMSYSVIIDCDFTETNMEYMDLQYCNINGCILDNTNIDNVNFNSTTIFNSIIKNMNFDNVDNFELFYNKTRILPEGEIVGWNKIDDKIVEFQLLANSKRVNTFDRKCRTDMVIIKHIENGVTVEINGNSYGVGDTVISPLNTNPNETNGDGIYFYITIYEAENS